MSASFFLILKIASAKYKPSKSEINPKIWL
jgi:hypothetical protein